MQARSLLGLSYYGTKRFAEAAKHLELAAKAEPDNIRLRQVLAQSCLWAKQFDCALEEFRQIEQRDPNSAAVHVLTGEALDGMGKTAEAIVEFQEAVKSSPQDPNLHFGLGYLYWKLKQYDEAATAFKGELAVDPENGQALAYLGDIEMKKNNPKGALPLLKRALQSRNDIRIAYVDLGAILTEQGQYPAAIAALKRAVELDPEQPDAHYRLGRAYQATANQAAAQKEFAKVRELHDKSEEDVARKMSAAPPALQQ
jgi:tetratricopeptide (TPR) repeat protein